MGNKILTCWTGAFALAGSWCAHIAQLLVSWHGTGCDLAAAAAPAYLWLVYLTSGEAASGTQAHTLHCKKLPGKCPAYGTDNTRGSFPDPFNRTHLALVREEASIQSPHPRRDQPISDWWQQLCQRPTGWLSKTVLLTGFLRTHSMLSVQWRTHTHTHKHIAFLTTQGDGKKFIDLPRETNLWTDYMGSV